MKKFLFILLFTNISSCFSQQEYDLIPKILSNNPEHFFDNYIKQQEQYRIQVIYTQIDRDSLNKPHFKDYYYRIEENEYFYPASTVKLPFAIFALEQLEAKSLNINSYFCYKKDSSLLANHPNFEKTINTIAQYINKALVVSDNQAANTLFDLATPSYIDFRMKSLGFQQARLRQRFAKTDTVYSKITKPFILLDSNRNKIFEQNEIQWKHHFSTPEHKIKLGKGQLMNGKVIGQPFDFTYDNFIPLPEIHELLKKIMLLDSSENGLFLSSQNIAFIQQQLSMYPKECTLNNFKPENGYYDACRKYLMFGTENEMIDTNLRIFNKVGLAYGFVTDIAYIVDYKENIEFMLSAVIYANKDDIINDGKYDYESVAFPFMKNLGKTFFEYEKHRTKKWNPRLIKLRY